VPFITSVADCGDCLRNVGF